MPPLGGKMTAAGWDSAIGAERGADRAGYSVIRGARGGLVRRASSTLETCRSIDEVERKYSADRGVGACARLGAGYSAQPTPSACPDRYSARAARSHSPLDT